MGLEKYNQAPLCRRNREIHPHVKDIQRPRLCKSHRGLQIFDMRVDFPVPVKSSGRFY